MPPILCGFGFQHEYSNYFKEAKSIDNSIVTNLEHCLD
jgi:hypothetical protein